MKLLVGQARTNRGQSNVIFKLIKKMFMARWMANLALILDQRGQIALPT